MVRAKKKTSWPAPDFKKAKQKVGGRKVAPANETRTDFRSRRINVPSQLQRVPDAVDGDLNIADLLSKIRHHNARERRRALDELGRALQRFRSNVASAASVTNIIRIASRLVLDDDRGVRRGLRALLRCADFALIAPFAKDQLNLFVLAAMTHPSMVVRVDGVAALDTILDMAVDVATGVRQQYLSAIVAALAERTETDALGLANTTLSVTLRCCVALLTTGAPTPQTLTPNPNLALLHTPDPFRPPSTAPPPVPADLLEQLASSLIECAIECAGDNAASLALCVRGLYACTGPHLSAAVRDRLGDHVLSLFAAPYADPDLNLQICRLAAVLHRSLPDRMMSFVSRSLSSTNAALPCEILLLHDELPPALSSAFIDGLDRISPSSSALDVCRKFFPQFPNDVRERVLDVIARRFVSSDAITLLLDGVRFYQTPFDPVPLLQGDLFRAAEPGDQSRIAALFGYVDVVPETLPALAAKLCDGTVTVAARSLLLDLVMACQLPTEAVLSLLMTIAVRSDQLLLAAGSWLSRLNSQRPGACSATFEAIARLLPTLVDCNEVRRLVTLRDCL